MRAEEHQRFADLSIKNARKKWNGAWDKLTCEMREAFVAYELLLLMIGQQDSDEQTIGEWEPIVWAAFKATNPDEYARSTAHLAPVRWPDREMESTSQSGERSAGDPQARRRQ